jgi:hypothetical protein
MSGHENKPNGKGVLTLWRGQRENHVRIQKQTERLRDTHTLVSTEGRTSQDAETNQASEGHSLPGEHRARDTSGHERRLGGRGELTS